MLESSHTETETSPTAIFPQHEPHMDKSTIEAGSIHAGKQYHLMFKPNFIKKKVVHNQHTMSY